MTRGAGGWGSARRRQLGIWFALKATPHAALILNGWARWSLRRVLGYEVIPQLGRALMAPAPVVTSAFAGVFAITTAAGVQMHHLVSLIEYLSHGLA